MALDGVATWRRMGRTYPNVRIALTVQDIIDAKAANQASARVPLSQDTVRLRLRDTQIPALDRSSP